MIFFEKNWHFASTAFYETHTEKEDTDIRVGDILTLEGGLGKSFMDGALSVGAAYYVLWKPTDDDLGGDSDWLGGGSLGKYQVYGVAPERVLPAATKKKLYGFISSDTNSQFFCRLAQIRVRV